MRTASSRMVRKLAVFGLAFLFVVTPLAPAFGQAAESPVAAPLTESQADTVETAPDIEPVEPDGGESLLMEGVPPRFDRELTFGRLPVPEPDSLTGALTYSYRITVPPGRNGLQPDLKLQYNNQDTTQNSVFGAGWSLNIPFIQRLNKEGSDKLYSTSTPYFYSTLSGELLFATSSSSWESKVENGQFFDYATSSDTWVVKDKQGTTYIFGNATSTRQDDPGDSSKIFKWMLAETEDANGNSITYEYYKDAGQIYPSVIKYTHSATTTDGIFRIDFTRETRSDNATSTATGFDVLTNYRIDEVQVKINGSVTRKYEIAYTAGDNGQRSLISTITETGYDESGTPTALPATSFGFQASTTSWTLDNNWTIPASTYFTDWSSHGDHGTRLADVNGDGLTDLLKAVGGATRYTYLNTGSGWSASSTWDLPLDVVDISGLDRGVRLADVTGDGAADIVRAVVHSGTYTQEVYRNNGSGWTYDASWTFPSSLAFAEYSYGTDLGLRLFDVNGDGLPDLVRAIDGGGGADTQKVYINTGSGWTYDSSWVLPTNITFTDNTGQYDLGTRLDDVNGDGLLDLLWSTEAGNKVFLNDGHGWTQDPSWSIPVAFVSYNTNTGAQLGDITGDGLPDIVVSKGSCCGSQQAIYLNNGRGWTQQYGWTIPNNCIFIDADGYDGGSRLADVNGDGLADFAYLYQTFGGGYQEVYLNNHKIADAVTLVIYPQGGSKAVEYKPSPQYKDGSGNLLNPSLPLILHTVATTTESDGLGLSSTKTYTYAKGNFYFYNHLDRKYSGFGQVTETNAAGAKTITSYHGGTQNESNKGQYQDHVAKAGKPYRVEVRDASDNLYSLQINRWDKADLGGGRTFVKRAQSVQFSYDGDASHKEKADSATYNDTNGNVTQSIAWGEVSGSDDGTFSDTGSDKFTSAFTYATDTASIIYKVATETVTDQSANKVRETRNYYDGQSLGVLTKGNLTKEERWKTASTYIDTEKTYDSYGLVIQEKDPRDKTTNYVYDSYALYAATSTNPLSQKTDFYYDYSLGKPKETKDANNLTFQTVFDGLDRVKEEKQPDMTATSTLVLKTAYTYTNESVGLKTQRTDYLNSATSTDTYTYTDGLNRVIQTRKEAEDANTYAVSDVAYNNLGQVAKESLPYFSAGTSRTTATTTAVLLSTFGYDPLLRVTAVANAVGTTTNAFADWKTTITDPNGNEKHLYKDAHDNLWKVEEVNDGNTYTTLYEYNGNKNLTKIIDASSNVRNFTYDALGRRLTAQDLHAPADGTYGTWTYTYDDAGNTTQTVDPKSQTINYTYDDINRVLTEDYTGQAGTEQTFTYDTCTNGKPRLCSVASATATTTTAYNPLGQVKQEVKTVSGESYQTDYTHDRQGNVLTITNPDNSEVRYTYNTAGQLETIERKESGGSYVDVVTDFDYGPHGKVTYQEDANGTATTNTYDANALYRLSGKVTAGGGADLQDLAYTYDANGNITQTVDTSDTATAKTMTYGYDDLNRLTSAAATNATSTSPGNFSKTFGYDAVGNIATTSDSGTYTYAGTNYANPHAVTGIGGTTYVYDNSGNLTSKGAWTYAWDYQNRMTSAGNGTATSTYAYDHTTQRIKKSTSGVTTVYPTKYYNTSTATTTKHIFTPSGELVATVETTTGGGGGAIGFDATSNGGCVTDGVSPYQISWNHTTAGTDRLLVVGIAMYDDSENITGVTYGGTALTSIRTDTNSGSNEGETSLWYLKNPASGANNIVATNASSFTSGCGMAVSLTGVDQTTPLDAHNGTTADNANSVSTSVTTVADNAWLVDVMTANNAVVTQTVGSGQTQRQNFDGAAGQNLGMSTVNGKSPAGAEAMDWTDGGSLGTPDWAISAASFKPAAGGGSATTTVQYIHTDHLGGTGAVTDEDGDLIELTDYFPYGSARIEEGTFDEQRKFTGHEYDGESALTYANARYYNQDIGRWMSQDPAFLAIGDQGFETRYERTLETHLTTPQSLNSYSYVNNNPLVHVDESGEILPVLAALALGGAVANITGQAAQDLISGKIGSPQAYVSAAVGGAAGGASLPFLGLFGAGAVTGGVSETVNQGLATALDQNHQFSFSAIGRESGVGAFLSRIPSPALKGITKGTNSFAAVLKQILTKYGHSNIGNVSTETLYKATVSQSVGEAPEAVIRGAASNSLLQSLFAPTATNSTNGIDGGQNNAQQEKKSGL